MTEMPQGLERRMVLRLLAHWRDVCGDKAYPALEDFDPDEIPDIWRHIFIIDLVGQGAVFRRVGEAYVDYAGQPLDNVDVGDVPQDTLAQRSVEFLPEVLEKSVPISRGGKFTDGEGRRILYRSIVLPLSNDGETVTGLIGAANCREISIEEEREWDIAQQAEEDGDSVAA